MTASELISAWDMKKHPIGGAGTRVRSLRKNMTEAERPVWQMLRSHQMKGFKFRREVPIGPTLPTLRARARLIVEIDGGQSSRL
jgi:very-short-patch-repair endonuclease